MVSRRLDSYMSHNLNSKSIDRGRPVSKSTMVMFPSLIREFIDLIWRIDGKKASGYLGFLVDLSSLTVSYMSSNRMVYILLRLDAGLVNVRNYMRFSIDVDDLPYFLHSLSENRVLVLDDKVVRVGDSEYRVIDIDEAYFKEPSIQYTEVFVADPRELSRRLRSIKSSLVTLYTSMDKGKLILRWMDEYNEERSSVIHRSYMRKGSGYYSSYSRDKMGKIIFGSGYILLEYGDYVPLRITMYSGKMKIWLAPAYMDT